MEGFQDQIPPERKRPTMLKVLCILSIINCSLMILLYLAGTLVLAINSDSAQAVMDRVLRVYPEIQVDDPAGFFSSIGILSLMCLIANIASLLGVIMMWNLNKIGFYIYALAEISTNFFGLSVNASTNGGESYGGMIFNILLDLVFIVLFAVNLKHMNKNKHT